MPRSLVNRRGFTMVELLMAMTMLAVVGATIVAALTTQQRFVRATSDVGNMRSQVQTAALILPGDLRGVSATGRDIVAMSDSSIRARATIVSSVVCAVSGNTITLAPDAAYQSQGPMGIINVRLTSIMLTPNAATDSAFVWGQTGSSWNNGAVGVPFDIVSASTGACPSLHGRNFVNPTALTLTLASLPAGGVPLGTGVRVVRHVQYGLYQSTVDGNWYLGYRDPALGTYQYVAGPFLPYANVGASGLRFRYFDAANVATATPAQVARIEVTARAKTTHAVSVTGASSITEVEDSLRVGISLRNRN